jgi:signal transduction histidine kinase
LKTKPSGVHEVAPPSGPDLDNAAIWLVDDSALQREMTRQSLARHHDVVVFDMVGPMLERLATGQRPDLLVLDWHMPEISGLEACRYVRGVADGAELPIIVLTATGHHDDLLAGLSAGANDFVRKPCDETELAARVAALVRTKRLHSRLAVAESALRDEAGFRERFLAILAHDLRQPLNVFALGSETLAAAATPQEMRNRVKSHFDRATERMQRMIGELLDFSRSRPQGGGMPIAPESADLAVIVRNVVEEVRLAHPSRKLAIETCASCNGSWDADRLAQVVSNLVENALAHSSRESPVTIALTMTEQQIDISVENHGAPIAPALLTTLFDPFRRGGSRVVKDRGLGLGLYIVDQIAKAHGGAVSVKSEGGTTRFNVKLPIGGSPSQQTVDQHNL